MPWAVADVPQRVRSSGKMSCVRENGKIGAPSKLYQSVAISPSLRTSRTKFLSSNKTGARRRLFVSTFRAATIGQKIPCAPP
jgi:hypothetical protein